MFDELDDPHPDLRPDTLLPAVTARGRALRRRRRMVAGGTSGVLAAALAAGGFALLPAHRDPTTLAPGPSTPSPSAVHTGPATPSAPPARRTPPPTARSHRTVTPTRELAAGTPRTPPSPSAPTRAPQSPYCSSAELGVSVGPQRIGLGNWGVAVIFRNTASRSCLIVGYPGVAGLDSRGRQQVQARRTLAGYLGGERSGAQPPTVRLGAGQSAAALVEASDVPKYPARTCVMYRLLVTPPGSTQSIRLAAALPGCAGLTVHPVLPGSTGTDR